MYATGYHIRPLRAARRPVGLAAAGRVVAVLAAVCCLGVAVAVHASSAPPTSTVVVQPGDTLWSIAAGRYPSDDTRARVDQIESLNALRGPAIEVGETLQVPG